MSKVKAKNPNKNKVREAAVSPFNGRVYQPRMPNDGAGPMTRWNYLELPEGHEERVKIEKLYEGIKPLRKTMGTYGTGRGQP